MTTQYQQEKIRKAHCRDKRYMFLIGFAIGVAVGIVGSVAFLIFW